MRDSERSEPADGPAQHQHRHGADNDLDPDAQEAVRSPRKSHKSSKHSKKSKHKSRKDRDRAHSSEDEHHVRKAARHRRSKDGVGSDPEDGEILAAGGVVEGQPLGSFVAPVTDKPASGRVRAEPADAHGHTARERHSVDAAAEAPSTLALPERDMGEPTDLSSDKRSRKRERAAEPHDGRQGQGHAASEHDVAPPQPKHSRLGPNADGVTHTEVAPVQKPAAGSVRGDVEGGEDSHVNGIQGPGEESKGDQDTKKPSHARDESRGAYKREDSHSRQRRSSRERSRERDRDRPRERDVRDRDRDRDRDRLGRRPEAEEVRPRPRSPGRERERSPDRGRGYRDVRDRDRGVSDRGGGRSRSRERERQAGRSDDRMDRGRGGRDMPPRPDEGRRRDDRDRDRDRGRQGRDGSPSRGGGGERRGKENVERKPEPEEEPDEDVVGLLDEDPEAAEQRAIEERRKRLAEIKAKHTQQQAFNDAVINPTKAMLSLPQSTLSFQNATPAASGAPVLNGAGDTADTAANQADATPDRGGPTGQGDQADGEKTPEGDRTSSSDDGNVADGPVLDIWGNEIPQDEVESRPIVDESMAPSAAPGKLTEAERVQATAATTANQQVPSPDDEEEEDDMFALEDKDEDEGLGGGEAPGKAAGVGVTGPAAALKKKGAAGALADQYDDLEGYYNFQIGEMMDKRYEVFASYGKGVFGVVVRARDVQRVDDQGRPQEVAIKLIRSNETMYKASQTELSVLRKIAAADPENKKHCIKLLRHFEYRNHMCLVFEPMAMNLRDLTKKVGRNKGLNMEAVQLFACQLLIALRHLKKNQVLHADIKPDNILINNRHNKVKICDFGSAMMAGDNDITPYLVSRFYRPPEVVLGMKYDYAMDMWSIGCVVYELFTGRILFPGHSNNEMLKLMMDVKGPFKKNMLKTRCKFADLHFDQNDPNCPFISLEDDPITKTKVRKLIHNPAVKSSFTTLLSKSSGDKTKIAQLADLLEKMMMLEPERRIDPDMALRHPFVKEFLPRKEPSHKKGGAKGAGADHAPVLL